MSTKFPGGLISKTAPVPTGPYANSEAPGVWTLEQQAYWVEQGNWPTAGNVNPDAFIENLFSTWLYTGTGPSAGQTITNNIDLSTKGGMTWIKNRTDAGTYPTIIDTVRGTTKELYTNQTVAQGTVSNGLTAFTTSGFTLGTDTAGGNVNYAYSSPSNFASWTFRKQPKFFDVVTYTGNGSSTQVINHSLGSRPGAIFFKKTSATSNWVTYNRVNDSTTYAMFLNKTDAALGISNAWMTSTDFTAYQLGADTGLAADNMNDSGATYVAYLFAHDAGGFGLSGTDNVISCGSGTGGTEVNLGYEPQWVMIKKTATTSPWYMVDNMRGWTAPTGDDQLLAANSSAAEFASTNYANPTSTGFIVNAHSDAFIYIAIRRGPMAVPTDGTSVFAPVTSSATGSVLTSNFPVDMGLIAGRGAVERGINDRLRGFANTDPGPSPWLVTQSTAAETLNSNFPSLYNANNTSIQTGAYFGSASAVSYLFGRAPGFFDVVCGKTDGSGVLLVNHNLGVPPELIFVKDRETSPTSWYVLRAGTNEYMLLNRTDASGGGLTIVNTSTQFGNNGNYANKNQVVYMWATCPGVSKVGSYTGTAATLQINCGFTAGARFVLIKRTDSAGDWYVWDSARGIVAGNDPYLLLNSTAAEVTSTDYVDTYSAGFEISSTAPSAINASGGTFIFLAIA